MSKKKKYFITYYLEYAQDIPEKGIRTGDGIWKAHGIFELDYKELDTKLIYPCRVIYDWYLDYHKQDAVSIKVTILTMNPL